MTIFNQGWAARCTSCKVLFETDEFFEDEHDLAETLEIVGWKEDVYGNWSCGECISGKNV